MVQVEILSYSAGFRVDGNITPHSLMSKEYFNYGDESLLEKYQAHVSEELQKELSELNDLDVYMESNQKAFYNFFILTKDKELATKTFVTIAKLCKELHGLVKPELTLIISEKYIAETPFILSV
jgi:hypothetical protein